MINNLFKLLKPVFQKGAQQPVATAQTKSNRPPTSKVNDEKANDLYALILNNQKKKLVSGINARGNTFENRVAPTKQLASKNAYIISDQEIDKRPISSGSKTADKKQKINVKKQDYLPTN